MVLLAPGLWTEVHTTSSKQLLSKWVDWATSYYSSCRANNSGAFTEFIFVFFRFCRVLCAWATEERRHALLSWRLGCHKAPGSPCYLSVQKRRGALEWDPNWLIPWCLLSVTLGEAWEKKKKSGRLHFTIRLSKSFQRIPAKIAYLTFLFRFLHFF